MLEVRSSRLEAEGGGGRRIEVGVWMPWTMFLPQTSNLLSLNLPLTLADFVNSLQVNLSGVCRS